MSLHFRRLSTVSILWPFVVFYGHVTMSSDVSTSFWHLVPVFSKQCPLGKIDLLNDRHKNIRKLGPVRWGLDLQSQWLMTVILNSITVRSWRLPVPNLGAENIISFARYPVPGEKPTLKYGEECVHPSSRPLPPALIYQVWASCTHEL